MKKEEIHFGDLNRWLYGTTPPEFMIEVAIRTVLIYLILLLVVRFLGKRMSGQITLVELSIMMTLGAIVSPIMQIPDRGIMFGAVVLVVALVFQRGLNLWAVKNERVEHAAVGVMSVLIKDGVLNLRELERTNITKEQMFSLLREKNIQNLGNVKRAYMEACGMLSVFEMEQPMPGLPVLPATDPAISQLQDETKDTEMACCNCGHLQHIGNEAEPCEICTAHDWTKAYLQNSKEKQA